MMNELHPTKPPSSLKEELHRRALEVQRECQMTIVSDADFGLAEKKGSEILGLIKAIKDYHHPLKEIAAIGLELHRSNEKNMLAPIVAGKEYLARAMVAYRADRNRLNREREEAEHLLQREEAELAAFEMAESGVPQKAIDAVEKMESDTLFQATPAQELRGRTSFKRDYQVALEDIDLVDREFLLPATKAHTNAIIANAKARAVKTGGAPMKGFKVIATESAIMRRIK